MLNKAIQIAIDAHKTQTDKVGKPYILHLIRVMQRGATEEEQICGILHDVIEDTNWTYKDLKKEGFTDEIINALKCVTKKEGENYDDFINRIALNPLAVKVKLNDLRDNMDITRLNTIEAEDVQRLNKYLKAYHKLSNLNK